MECPYCGDFILKGSVKCPSCQLDLSKYGEKSAPHVVEKTVDDLLNEIIEIESTKVKEESKKFSCSNCSLLLDGTEERCPKCGQKVFGAIGLRCPICENPVDRDSKSCPRCGASFLRAGPGPWAPPKDLPEATRTTESELEARLRELEEMYACPKCGVLVKPEDVKCPKCGVNLTLEGLEAELPKAEPKKAEPKEVTTVEAALTTLGEIEKQSQKLRKARTLRSGKVTTISTKLPTAGKGLSNGVGQINGGGMVNGRSKVNGLGRVNGTGVTNGKSFVNGTGVSNGLRAKDRLGGPRGKSFLLRWQFLAVLVAILIIIPTLVSLSYFRGGSEFSADGKFGEWSSVPKLTARIQAASPDINIVQWAVKTEGDHLFFYINTQGDTVGADQAQGFYLFVDSDGSSTTGYAFGTIGADYLLELSGWNGTVQSTSMMDRSPTADEYNWSGWAQIDSFKVAISGNKLEAEATLPVTLSQKSIFQLISKDALDNSAVTYPTPSTGGVLIVNEVPSDSVIASGVISPSATVAMLQLTFTCQGADGSVDHVEPAISGASLAVPVDSFSLKVGQRHIVDILVDTFGSASEQFVTAGIFEAGINSTFQSVQIVGEAANAYVGNAPPTIEIDGAFADWTGRITSDLDLVPVPNANVDIDQVGNVSNSQSSYFYVSVEGQMCSGTFIPATLVKPSGSGGGGIVVPKRLTAEDVLTVYIDSDRSATSGSAVSLGTQTIGADQKIEIRGLFGRITSSSLWDYSQGAWTQSLDAVNAAKDSKRIEIGVSASSIGGSSDIDYMIETTSWGGISDLAIYNMTVARALAGGVTPDTWVVDSGSNSAYATAMSYQRKIFYDGTNYWSFYFDGTDTVHRYSTDDGQTWSAKGTVFKTSGVNETSIWYDSANNVVYAVGDTSTASQNVYLQKGTVAPASHTITWSSSDSTLKTSASTLAGKNTYICRDASGYIWVLSSNHTQTKPDKYDLTSFKSQSTDSIASWTNMGGVLASVETSDTIKGSIVPAGSGSDVWAIYTYSNAVSSRKYTGTWGVQTSIQSGGGSGSSTENAPSSVVVDSHGVVHVVYGTKRSPQSIEYVHNNTDATTYTSAVDFDAYIPTGVSDVYPTISLETSSGNLFVFWLRTDTSGIPQTIMGRKGVSGSWSNLSFDSQTSYAKQYLTSIYSVSGELKVCYQWTQNTTGTIEVFFDHVIPEFGDVAMPIMFILFLVAGHSAVSRRKSKSSL